LRELPFATLKAGAEKHPDGIPLAWTPRVDGVFLQDNPLKLIKEGKVARVPFVTGMYPSSLSPSHVLHCSPVREHG